jgi:hypothetical protein
LKTRLAGARRGGKNGFESNGLGRRTIPPRGNIDGTAWEHGIFEQAPATSQPTPAPPVNGTPPAATQFDGSSLAALSAVRAAVLDGECLSIKAAGMRYTPGAV